MLRHFLYDCVGIIIPFEINFSREVNYLYIKKCGRCIENNVIEKLELSLT